MAELSHCAYTLTISRPKVPELILPLDSWDAVAVQLSSHPWLLAAESYAYIGQRDAGWCYSCGDLVRRLRAALSAGSTVTAFAYVDEGGTRVASMEIQVA